MAIRLSVFTWPAALAVAVAAFVLINRNPAAATTAPAPAPAPVESAGVSADDIPDLADPTEPTEATAQQLPPNHPPITGTAAGAGSHGVQGGGESDLESEAAALEWKAPADWAAAPNTNSMRLATYRVGDATEVTVVRAGGSTEANVERWQGQFDGSPVAERKEKTVHGMKVTVVHIAGTFVGAAGMAPGASAESHKGWTLLAAIVDPGGMPYFFKMLGPSAQVERARAPFERMLDALAPTAAR